MKPFQVGITGGIGSGKSIVCKIFSRLGIPIYDADSRARWVMNNNQEIKEEIIAHFGKESYQDNQLNRTYIASKVFNDGEKVKLLNSLVHPKVGLDYQQWVEQHANTPYVVKEAALMIESGSYKVLDKLITVYAPEHIRIQRVRHRDPQRSEEEIKSIMQKQMNEEEKLKIADFIVYNDDLHPVLKQILYIHELLLKNFYYI